MADFGISDPSSHHHEVLVSANSLTAPKGRDTTTPLPTPAELAEMRAIIVDASDASEKEFEIAAWQAASHFPRLLDAVEALTAERDTYLRMLDQWADDNRGLHAELTEARSTIERLEAEVLGKVATLEREVGRAVKAETDRCVAIIDEAVRGEGALWAQPVEDPRGDRAPDCSDVLDRLPQAIRRSGPAADRGWYSTMRRLVEADHAAKVNAWPRHCHSPSSCTRNGACMYMHCRHEGQDIRGSIAEQAAAKEAAR